MFQSLKRHLFKFASFLIFGFIAGCQTPVTLSEPDFFPYRQKKVALLTFNAADTLSQETWQNLISHTVDTFQNHPEFASFLTESELEKALQNVPGLANVLQRYRTTMVFVGVSDKDLVRPLQKTVKIDQFLLIQLEDYPCTESCPSDLQFLLRLKLFELQSGLLIYQIRLNYEVDEEELLPEVLSKLVLAKAQEILAEFSAKIKVPWHRWRYENLKKNVSSTN